MEEKDKKERYWSDPKTKITRENVKEFYFDMKCDYKKRYYDFKRLNIPKRVIIEWTTEYHRLELKEYEKLEGIPKFKYIRSAIVNFGKRLKLDLIITYYKDYVSLLKQDKIQKEKIKDMIDPIFEFTSNGLLYFGGFITAFNNLDEEKLMHESIDLLIELVKENEDRFEEKEGHLHYFEGLKLFGEICRVNLKEKLEM